MGRLTIHRANRRVPKEQIPDAVRIGKPENPTTYRKIPDSPHEAQGGVSDALQLVIEVQKPYKQQRNSSFSFRRLIAKLIALNCSITEVPNARARWPSPTQRGVELSG